MLKVVMQLLAPLSDVFALREAEKSFPRQLWQLGILASKVAV